MDLAQPVARVVLSVIDRSIGETTVCLIPMEDLLMRLNFSSMCGDSLLGVENLPGESLRHLAIEYLQSALTRLSSSLTSNISAERLAIVQLDDMDRNRLQVFPKSSVMKVEAAEKDSSEFTPYQDDMTDHEPSTLESYDSPVDENTEDTKAFPHETNVSSEIPENLNKGNDQRVAEEEPEVNSSDDLKIKEEARMKIRTEKQKPKKVRKRKTIAPIAKTFKVPSCNTCGKIFSSVHSLKKHSIVHTDKKPHLCLHCGKGYRSSNYLKTHELLHKGGRPRPHICDICGKAFHTKSCLVTHNYTHTGEKAHICEICGQTFSGLASLFRHRVIHTGQKFACKTCGKSYCRPQNLVQHERLHTGEIKHACDICSKEFTRKETLFHHKFVVHTGLKPWACELCDKAYTQKSKLEDHKRSHTGETPFVCKLCNKNYRLSKSLKKHNSKYHVNIVLTEELPFTESIGPKL